MLRHLTIRNLALIDHLEIPFEAGFTVLTGETGAGKSILIDALGLVLGHRADTALIRSGTDQAEVHAEFILDEPDAARGWLREQALEDGDEPERCLLRRVISSAGRTRAFINDRPVSLAALRELGSQLVDIFGQGESQMLVRADVQRMLLDSSGDYAPALTAVAAAAEECRRLGAAIEALHAAGSRDPAQIDYLRFQIDELRALALGADEPAELEAEQRQLAHADQLLDDGNAAHAALYDDDESIYNRLAATAATLSRLGPLHAGLAEVTDIVTSAQALVREAADSLRDLLNGTELDPERLQAVEARMATLHDMARKHRVAPAELPTRLETLEAELDTLEGAAGQLDALEAEADRALARYQACAEELGRLRRAAAARLASAATARIRRLGMADAQLSIGVDTRSTLAPSPHGNDVVRFDFTANPGQPARALAKVASGGELSRISLALQVAVEGATPLGTMIFDEVDAGIGGSVAETVGTELAELGNSCQVLCVTHLAQVAGQGRHHLFVSKQVRAGQTYTDVTSLDHAGRVAELARMAGGHKVTRTTEAHARSLLGGRGDGR